MYVLANNTYISPIESETVPRLINGSVPDYIVVGKNKYIYGGNFPPFYSTLDDQTVNYTDNDLYSLATLLDVNYIENIDMYDLYKECRAILNKVSKEDKIIIPKKSILEYHSPIVTIKKNTSFVNYVIRSRIGVKPPGDSYIVYKDEFSRMYAVPFKYSDDGYLPVYNLDFKGLKDYYIEGPCIYEESDKSTFIFSNKYILVEYSINTGKVTHFREGVNSRFIKKIPKQKFDSCNRFTDKISCNDINSYSIDKLKCQYIDKSCISLNPVIDEIKKDIEIDIKSIIFKKINGQIDTNKTKLWNQAVNKSVKYISDYVRIHNISESKIQEFGLMEKNRLLEYSKFLNQFRVNKLSRIIEEPVLSTDKFIYEILSTQKQEEEQEEKQEEKQEEEKLSTLLQIDIPILDYTYKYISSRMLKKGNLYLLEDNSIVKFIEIKLDNIYFENDIVIKIGNQRIKENILSEIKINKTFNISRDSFDFLSNLPNSFYYYIIEPNIRFTNDDIKITYKKIKSNKLPFSELYKQYLELNNDDNIITTDIIYMSMAEYAYSTFKKTDTSELELHDNFPAELNAKIYSIKYSVDLERLSRKITGKIKVEHVFAENNDLLPKLC